MAYDHNIYSKIVSGELSPEEINHLKTTGEWQEIQKILKATEDIYLPSHDVGKNYEKLIRNRDKNKSSKVINLLKPILTVAAVLLTLFTITVVMKEGGESYKADIGESLALNLLDESEVLIGSRSSLSHSDNFLKNREVKLEGEAFFKVAKGSTFNVKTKRGTVSVLGTEFNVNTWNDRFEVECYEGKVKVVSSDSETILTKGERITISRGVMDKSTISYSKPLWTNGEYRFHNESIQSVMRSMERQFGMKIRAQNLDRPFSGKYLKTSIKEALDLVCTPMDLKWEIRNDVVFVTE